MIFLDVQDIITSYLEGILNSGNDPKSFFHLGYYNFVTPNKFEFTQRVGAKYNVTKFVPAMLENWDGEWDPLPGIEYIELKINLTVMVQLNANRDQVIYDLNRFSKEMIGRYDEIIITDQESEDTETIYVAIGGGIPRTMGAAITWGGRRYLRMMLPLDVTFSKDVLLGNIVENRLDGILLTPVHRSYDREADTYPVQLLSTTLVGTNDTKTKKNLNKENALAISLTFSWTDATDFIINYMINPDYDQNREFLHAVTLKNITYIRKVNIIGSNFTPSIGKGADVVISVVEAFNTDNV